MENNKAGHRISASQFFILLFVSQAIGAVGINAGYLGGENMLEAIVSYVLAMALGLLISLPVWLVHRRWPEQSVADAAQSAFGKAGKAVPVLYILYFVVTGGAALGLFQIFLLDTVNPEFSAALVMAAVAAVAVYGAARGIETVARCGLCVFVGLLLGSLLVFSIVASRFEAENLEPLFVNGMSQTFRGTALFLSRTSVFADMAVLLPQVTGRKRAGFLGWAGGAAAFVGILLLLLAGCLGPYGAAQNFPVFSLSSMTEIRSMQRLDAVFVGIWIMGLTVRLSCGLYACRVCFSSLWGKRFPRGAVIGSGAAMLLLAFAVVKNRGIQRLLLSTPLPLGLMLLTACVLPLLVAAKKSN